MLEMKDIQVFGWEAALRGMRNPKRSHDRGDSLFFGNTPIIGERDKKLMLSLLKGASHRKYLRYIHIQMDVKAGSHFWKEFSTYKYPTSNSTSLMHDDFTTPFKRDDFENVDGIIFQRVCELRDIYLLNRCDKTWRDLIDNIPFGYMYTRTIDMNYETFITMYKDRKNHKLHEWRDLMVDLRFKLPYMDDILKKMEAKQW